MPAAHSLHVAPLKPLALVQSQPQLPVLPVAVPPLRQSMVPAMPESDTVHASAEHAVRPLKVPSDVHVAVRVAPLEYPALHVTVTDASVTAVMLPAVE